MTDRELNLSEDGTKDMELAADELFDAVVLAEAEGTITWVVDDTGKRTAAIVPPDVAEHWAFCGEKP